MKKTFPQALCTLVLICCLATTSLGASPESDFIFYINQEHGYAVTMDYLGFGGHVEIPSSYQGYPVTRVGKHTFRLNTNVTSVTLPETTDHILSEAFVSCPTLEWIYIPASVKVVDSKAFQGREALTDVYYGGSMEQSHSIDWGDSVLLKPDKLEDCTWHYNSAPPSVDVNTGPGFVPANKNYDANGLPYVTHGAPLAVPGLNGPGDRVHFGQYFHEYFVETSSGYTRIVNGREDGDVRHLPYVEQYNAQFQLTKRTQIPLEMSSYMGFYEGEDYYYMMYTGTNVGENDDAIVVRIVQYDKYWNRVNQCDISGINTVNGHTASMAESGGNLLVHTAHTMYRAIDGLNHQANLRLTIDIETMKLVAHGSGIGGAGYVSHSFEQLVDTSADGTVVTADLGDGYPRAHVLHSWPSANISSASAGQPEEAEILQIYGETGDNTTNTTIGGLEIGTSVVMLAGSSVTQNANFDSNKDFNIYLSTTPKSNFTTQASSLQWITNYDGISSYASKPYLVELDPNRFILMWNQISLPQKEFISSHWVYFDGNGQKTSQIYQGKAPLGAVQPLHTASGDLVWCFSDNAAPTFYTLNLSTNQVTEGASATTTPPTTTPSTTSPFTDVPTGHWAFPYVSEMAEDGYVSGKSPTTFAPDDRLTYADFSTMISNAFYGKTLVKHKENASGEWWSPFMQATYERGGLANTTAGNHYQSNHSWGNTATQGISRYDMAVMILNLLDDQGVAPLTSSQKAASLDKISDSVSSQYQEAVATALHHGFITGRSNGTFDGSATLSRAEASVVLSGLVNSTLVQEENVKEF